MDTVCLNHCLTEDERFEFEKDGFFVVKHEILCRSQKNA